MSEYNFGKITGTLVYIQIQEPVKAFVKPGFPAKPDEFKASVVLTDEDYVDAFEAYAKSLDTLASLKKVKTAEFQDKYKIPAPEGAGKNVWVLTFRKSTELGKTGKPVPEMYRPKVFQKMGDKFVDITRSKLVGNGSKGVISVDRFDRSNGGSSLYLKNVLVTDLVEYNKPEGTEYEPGSEFEDGSTKVESMAKPTATSPQPSPANAPTKGKTFPKAEIDDLDSCPF